MIWDEIQERTLTSPDNWCHPMKDLQVFFGWDQFLLNFFLYPDFEFRI